MSETFDTRFYMAPKKNPLKLNALQLKTLTILQQLARFPETSTSNEESGEVMVSDIPLPERTGDGTDPEGNRVRSPADSGCPPRQSGA